MHKLHCNFRIVSHDRGTTTYRFFCLKPWAGPPHTHKGVPDVHIYVCIWDPFVCFGWAPPKFSSTTTRCSGTSIGTHYARIAMQFVHTLVGFSGSGDQPHPQTQVGLIKMVNHLDYFPAQFLFSHFLSCPLDTSKGVHKA